MTEGWNNCSRPQILFEGLEALTRNDAVRKIFGSMAWMDFYFIEITMTFQKWGQAQKILDLSSALHDVNTKQREDTKVQTKM